MQGKIVSVDEYENIGTLCDENNNEITFSLDDCVDFEDIPFVDQIVEFGINSGEIYFVQPSNQGRDDIHHIHENSTIKKSVQEEITPKDKKTKKHYQSNIPLTLSIEQCINDYFQDITYSIKEYEAEFEDYEELNYPLMKRFLNTAYNNLIDMDSSFMDEELILLHSDLQALDKIYTKLLKKGNIPEIAYENIFLDKQIHYKENKKKMESNSSEIFTLESSAKTLEAQITNYENRIKENRVLEQAINEIKKDLKRYRTYYVDTLHKMATLKDENIFLKESLVQFEQKHKKEFLQIYEVEFESYFALLKRQLDGYAYVFDQKMWERAEVSSSIIAFFKKAHIDEDFSSKTFLKYFIKTLDKNKLSKEMKKLESLLYYLESRAKKRFIVIEENLVEADKIKHIIRRFDKDYNVESIDKPRSVYYRKDLKIIDCIFIDYSLKNPPLLEFLSMLKVRIKQTNSKAKICILAKNVTKEMLASIKNAGIEHIISLHVEENQLQENLKYIVESEL